MTLDFGVYKVWPLKLGGLLDETLSSETLSALAAEFCSADACCLDSHFSARLRSFMQAGYFVRVVSHCSPAWLDETNGYQASDLLRGGALFPVAACWKDIDGFRFRLKSVKQCGPMYIRADAAKVKLSQMRKLINSEIECNFARAAQQRMLVGCISCIWSCAP